jgi:urease accessory protein
MQVDGRLCLNFEYNSQHQSTRMLIKEQREPLRVIRAFPRNDGSCLIHLHNLSGGILAGDQLRTIINIGPDANVQVTTSGSTRVYRSRPDIPPAAQSTLLTIGKSALLEYLPDSLIPFAGSNYEQTTQIELAEEAGLFAWEVLAPGRDGLHEYLKLDIVAGQTPILLERAHLNSANQSLMSSGSYGRYRYLANFYCCCQGRSIQTWQSLEKDLASLAHDLTVPGQSLWGASVLVQDGLIVRGLTISSNIIYPALIEFWRKAKQELYGTPVILPRKVS